jgi:hypothetical protein
MDGASSLLFLRRLFGVDATVGSSSSAIRFGRMTGLPLRVVLMAGVLGEAAVGGDDERAVVRRRFDGT